MRKALVLIAFVGVLAVTGSAQAGCNTRCLNNRINVLSGRINRDTAAIKVLAGCLNEVPVTWYGTTTGGYVWDPGAGGAAFDTSALDITNSGDSVGLWVLSDKCNRATSAGARDVHGASESHAIAPLAVIAPFTAHHR